MNRYLRLKSRAHVYGVLLKCGGIHGACDHEVCDHEVFDHEVFDRNTFGLGIHLKIRWKF